MAKQIKTFTAGSVLTASDVNSYLMNQAVIAAQSTDRPTSPSPGMTIWETDTKRLMVYQSATTGWTPPWNMAWGVVQGTGGTGGYGYVRSTSSQAITSTSAPGTQLTNASITFTAYTNRLYRVSAQADMTHSAAGSIGSLLMIVDTVQSGTVTIGTNTAAAGGVNDRMAVMSQIITLASGSHTITMNATTGSGTLTIGGSSVVPTIFCVEDAGPVGAPA